MSYHTVFGIVPLAIVTLLIFKFFPAYSHIGEKMKVFVYRQANLTAFKSPAPNDEEAGETKALTDKSPAPNDEGAGETKALT
ncbi:MAG: hypothetical protein ACYTE3_08655, partial [Planctomycetota bacterium]